MSHFKPFLVVTTNFFFIAVFIGWTVKVVMGRGAITINVFHYPSMIIVCKGVEGVVYVCWVKSV